MESDNLINLKSWFTAYCASFSSNDSDDQRNIDLKEEHTHLVCANMNLLTGSMALEERDKMLAEVIALFHDVGRFAQYRQYRTFKDSMSTNHALLGAKVLSGEKVLECLPMDERRLVLRAVALHNVFQMPTGMDDRSTLFLKLIRDADKLDIWRVFIEYYSLPEEEKASAVGLGFPDIPSCTPTVLAALRRGEMVNLSLLTTLNDFKLLQLSWVFDLNFARSFALVAERGYVERLAAALPGAPEIEEAVDVVRTFVAQRVQDPKTL